VSAYYPGRSVYRYFSKIDGARSFDTAEEAAKNDRELAIQTVTSTSVAGFDAALRFGDEKLVAALRFLAEEIGEIPRALEKA
jgi:hypothetical protein